ncbi:S8 family peptidase [Actinokineospora enzanensis]|uniref:S8 family peptidase n=1 Tax=Actinokineospora enzanensis TaxID=155975 RepID=UPI00035C3811|nr:S8 family serine peptidase [Actinokineospora enzanensis]
MKKRLSPRTTTVLVSVAAVGGLGLAVAPPALSAESAAQPALIRDAGSADAIAGRYIVVFKAQGQGLQAVSAAATSMAQRYGGTVQNTYDAVFNGFSATMSADAAANVARDPGVQYVQQATRVRIADTQSNPPNWGDDRIDQNALPLNQTYNYPANAGQGAHVYVLDTGINPNHVDFTGRILPGYDFVDKDNAPTDCHGHGTHVSGTAVGTTYGVAKKATVTAVRVLDCGGSGSNDNIIAGLNWVKTNAVKPAVVNYSVGCYQRCSDSTIDNAVKSLIASGIQWVQAAGNANDNACYFSPQKLPEAITVGNVSRTDARNGTSNYGSCLDLFAPGTDIVSADYRTNTGTATMTGTSMASPHTAGAVAVYLGQHPDATPAQVRDALVNNGTTGKLTGIGSGSPNVLLYTAFMNGGTNPDNVTVAKPADQTATVGTPFSLTNSATGGTAPYTWSATGLPDGLTIATDTGTVSGTPTAAGTSNVTVTAKESGGKTGTATFAITVSPGGGGTCDAATNDTDYPIADLSTVESKVTLSGCTGNASATATVAVDIKHTYIGDLIVTLVAPDGTAFVLHNRMGGSIDNLVKTFTVDLSGEARNGTWTLRVEDAAAVDIGKIDSWTLTT